MVMMAIEDRESNADQWSARIPLQIFSVGVADQEVDGLGKQERPHMPEILTGINVAILSKRRTIEERLNLRFPSLAAVRGKHMRWLRAEFEQEARKTEAEIGIAIDRELFAVNMRA